MKLSVSAVELVFLSSAILCATIYSSFIITKSNATHNEQVLAIVCTGLLATSMLGAILNLVWKLVRPLVKQRYIRIAGYSLIIACFITVVIMFYVMSWILQQNPLFWIVNYLTSYSDYRYIFLCMRWTMVLSIAVPVIQFITREYEPRQIISRKYFHFLAVFLFAPAITHATEFTVLAFGVGVCGLLVVEYIRLYPVMFPRLSETINTYYAMFLDSRDLGRSLVLTHIYLLIGIAAPVWMWQYIELYYSNSDHILNMGYFTSTANPRRFSTYIWLLKHLGWISVGIGDSMGAIVGTKYGKTRWIKAKDQQPTVANNNTDSHSKRPKSSGTTLFDNNTDDKSADSIIVVNKRTIEGSLGCFLGILIGYLLALYMEKGLISHVNIQVVPFTSVLISTAIVSTLIEAFCNEIDNLVLPLATCAVYIVLVMIMG